MLEDPKLQKMTDEIKSLRTLLEYSVLELNSKCLNQLDSKKMSLLAQAIKFKNIVKI